MRWTASTPRRVEAPSDVAAASALLAGCQSQNEKLIPYLIPPDEGVTPGRATYYASSCTSVRPAAESWYGYRKGGPKRSRGIPIIRSTGGGSAPGGRRARRFFTIPIGYARLSKSQALVDRGGICRSLGMRVSRCWSGNWSRCAHPALLRDSLPLSVIPLCGVRI